MKKAIWKIMLIICLIPLGVAFVLTGIYCLFSNQFFEWFWITEWMCSLPEILAYYVIYFSVFAFFGVTAFYVFYEKATKAVLMSLVLVGISFVFPILRYVVRHFCFLSTRTAADMWVVFETDLDTSFVLLIYVVIALFVVWIEKAFYKWILKEKPERTKKMFSPKNPVGLAMLIFFAARAVLSTLMFVLDGEYTAESLFLIGVEYVINLVGFFVGSFGASICAKDLDAARAAGK